MSDDPMSLVHDLAFVGMVGIIDPLRAEAKDAVQTALRAGHRRAHDHRRPRRDGAGDRRDARARAGAISGTELQALSDEELSPAARAARVRPRLAARTSCGSPG